MDCDLEFYEPFFMHCPGCGHKFPHKCPKCHWECKEHCHKCSHCNHWFDDDCHCPKCHHKFKHCWS